MLYFKLTDVIGYNVSATNFFNLNGDVEYVMNHIREASENSSVLKAFADYYYDESIVEYLKDNKDDITVKNKLASLIIFRILYNFKNNINNYIIDRYINDLLKVYSAYDLSVLFEYEYLRSKTYRSITPFSSSKYLAFDITKRILKYFKCFGITMYSFDFILNENITRQGRLLATDFLFPIQDNRTFEWYIYKNDVFTECYWGYMAYYETKEEFLKDKHIHKVLLDKIINNVKDLKQILGSAKIVTIRRLLELIEKEVILEWMKLVIELTIEKKFTQTQVKIVYNIFIGETEIINWCGGHILFNTKIKKELDDICKTYNKYDKMVVDSII